MVCVRFVVDKEALEQIFLPVLHFSPVSNIKPMLHTHHHLHVTITGRTNGRSLGTFQKTMIFRKSEGNGEKDTLPFSFFGTSKGWQRWNKSHAAVM